MEWGEGGGMCSNLNGEHKNKQRLCRNQNTKTIKALDNINSYMKTKSIHSALHEKRDFHQLTTL